MQLASRTNRRYITPTMKGPSRTIPPTNIKPNNVSSISHSSPKKIVDKSTTKLNEALTLKNFVDHFHHDELQIQPEHDSINSNFSWLNDESKSISYSDENLPESIEIFPSTDIDQDLNKRASLLLNQTFSAHSSDTGHISNTDIDSTRITIMYQQPTRPISTRMVDSKVEYKIENNEDDILYQWRLRRRLEQATNNEPISFSSKISNRSNISPIYSVVPLKPIEVQTVTSSPIVLSSSPKKEQQQSSTTTNHEAIMTPISLRQYSAVSTQTIQDACIQTSLTLSTIPNIVNEIDLVPTHDDDDDQHLSICHRPPVRSKCEIAQISSSPLTIKRHHRTFRPVVLVEHPTIVNNSLNTVQSSQESTLTQVTSIMINENNNNNNRHIENNNNTIAINEIQDDEEIDDEILYILKQKRNELLIQFREIEQSLANMIS
ncbi:unnamed protein product [Rotaria sp. Silwood2]|nr:unnamed protein product [Rotaria sp. Silwood2]CAF4432260.1 unnamed protein product [Rotaria sp. Silwood2]